MSAVYGFLGQSMGAGAGLALLAIVSTVLLAAWLSGRRR